MLDAETKSRIDSARQMLVGKVPDPKSQVEQITIAMIYKFMDDMDAEAVEFGGKRTFFAGEYAKYGWSKLMKTGIAGHEMLALYSDAIGSMTQNPGLPPLFRDIFKNAYLPYRDPETLRAFLKIINEFHYDHSERLGDAFEYLLSILGSQGDAGQFRTPRHIIDFMVEIMKPQKNEVIMDPACGTAGFLISAYKHILRNNIDKKGNSTLTPDQKAKLVENFKGYDISPDMVRLSLVNLYLHGFTDPHIFEYDTLTSEERWNEFADVILANPPFMSPKGGIKPHKRFSVSSSRSEVLFVDYMVEHLTPHGRAAIIVPEGVIFQSGTAYRRLREVLLKESLIGVISLPSGVFQPYSGVKTSILILDKRIAKSSPKIMFSDIQAIGVSLGVKRTLIEENHLPLVLNDYAAYYAGNPISNRSFLVDRSVVIENDCNLSAERYRPAVVSAGTRSVKLKEVCTLVKGSYSSTKTEAGPYPLIVTAKEWLTSYNYQMEGEAVCVPLISSTGHGKASINRIHFVSGKFAVANLLVAIQPKSADVISARFLYLVLDFQKKKIAGLMKGAANVSMKVEDLAEFQIPLPPLDVQKEIVAEIEGYQKVINGARAVLDNYRPYIDIRPEWPMVKLGELTKPEYGFTEKASEQGDARFIRITDISAEGRLRPEDQKFITLTKGARDLLLSKGDILVARTGATFGKTMIFEESYPAVFASFLIRLRFLKDKVLPHYYWAFAQSDLYWSQANALMTGGGQPQFNGNALVQVKIPLPPIDIQKEIVVEIEAEQALVAANKELIARMETKIQGVLARVWGTEP